ncbi:MAG: NUDIX hydrolase [Candidatus Zixiibacteriota bacterium]
MILATLCYIRKDGKTLMLYRNKKENDFHEGKYNGLGGKFEDGESPEECVIREVREESGLEIEEPKLHGVITFPNFDMVNDWYVFIFSADRFKGNLIESPEGRLEWVDDDKLLDLPLWDGDSIFLKWVYQKDCGFFSAKFNYHNRKMTDYTVDFY